MLYTYYGVCRCGKWGKAPTEFKENKHFLVCSCGLTMYLQVSDPKEAGYREKDRTQISIKKQ